MNEDSDLIAAKYGSNFALSLMNVNNGPPSQAKNITLKPGNYIVMIDPLWHQSANYSASYKNIVMDIYGPEVGSIDELEDETGFEHLARALKKHA